MVSTLTARGQWEDKMVRERTGRPPSDADTSSPMAALGLAEGTILCIKAALFCPFVFSCAEPTTPTAEDNPTQR